MPPAMSWSTISFISPSGWASSGSGAVHPGRLRSELLIWVRTQPGHRTETPTSGWVISSSTDMVSDRVTTACLVTLYGDMPGGEVSPAMDAVFTMWPPPLSMIERRERPDPVDHPPEVDPQDPAPRVLIDLPRQSPARHSGVVAGNVQRPEDIDRGDADALDVGGLSTRPR